MKFQLEPHSGDYVFASHSGIPLDNTFVGVGATFHKQVRSNRAAVVAVRTNMRPSRPSTLTRVTAATKCIHDGTDNVLAELTDRSHRKRGGGQSHSDKIAAMASTKCSGDHGDSLKAAKPPIQHENSPHAKAGAMPGQQPADHQSGPTYTALKAEADYAAPDAHALAPLMPKGSTWLLEDLALHLTAPFRDPDDKLRAVFRWIAANISYDWKAYQSGNLGTQTPESVLSKRTGVCAGYSNLLYAMCEASKCCPCRKISGYSKGCGYVRGESFRGNDSDHAWNAVFLRGRWHLVDACWAAGNVDSVKNTFIREWKPQWWLTHPDWFAVSHYPESGTAADLCSDRKLTVDDFAKAEAVPSKGAAFYSNQFELRDPAVTESGVVPVGQVGETTEFTLSHAPGVKMMARLELAGNTLVEKQRAVMVQPVTCSSSIVSLRVPSAAKFALQIFSKSASSSDSASYSSTLHLLVDASKAKPLPDPNAWEPFPEAYPSVCQDRLVMPVTGLLRPEQQVSFEVHTPANHPAAADTSLVVIMPGNNWIDFDTAVDVVGAEQTTKWTLKVTVPAGAKPGAKVQIARQATKPGGGGTASILFAFDIPSRSSLVMTRRRK